MDGGPDVGAAVWTAKTMVAQREAIGIVFFVRKGVERPAKLLLVFLMLVAFVYSACAIHYGLYQLFGPYGPLFHIGQWTWHLNDEILALATGRKFAEGPGSTTYAQKERYGRNWYFMSPHQVLAHLFRGARISLASPSASSH